VAAAFGTGIVAPLSRVPKGTIVAGGARILKRGNLSGWLFVVLVAGLAEVIVRAGNLGDSVAAPSAAVRALASELWAGRLSQAIVTTLHVYAEGLAVAIAIGVVAGIAIGSSRTLLAASSVVLEFLRAVPAVALIPLAILWFGLGVPMHRFVIAYAATWPILIATLYGVRGTDRLLHDVARTAGETRLGTVVRVTAPAALPGIAAGIRLSAVIALNVAVTVEFINGGGGIGAYMQRQRNAYNLPELYGAIVLTALLGYAIHLTLRAAEQRALFWVGEHRLESR